ncbi:hypothetical protein CspeluHIS016_0400320 [Cutaneotrichosporon spelunceum]|uniref:RRM domain-containing protein n=1 Tax=Cutaneotrichosporon spelunceum TaxID=1672016 RepID=A0AAD3TV63_9TREE|nr:hypothetical protein CspeluHIS016_0400320 [Cutaneotrichosporon spelunceum]
MDADFIPLEGTPVPTPKKERTRPDAKVQTTLFVSSLPYNATSTDLVTHFSFIGPVRHGFVATDRESGKSKGVGYVTYAMKEDAERAVTELNGSEFGAKGRKIRVSWADKKPGKEITDVRPAKKARVTAGDEEEDTDPDAIRTLILTGLPADLTKAVLWKKVRKAHPGIELAFPVEGEDATAHLVFPTHGEAVKSIPKLHGHTYKGALLSAVLKKRLAALSSKGEGKAPSHAGRLIVRNLAWETTEADLRATFLPFGPIQAIDLPTLPSKLPTEPGKPAPPPRARGFAFVWFMARKDAEKAMAAVNGKPIKAAPNAAVAKGKQGRLAKKGEVGDGRPVAVDWAMSKEKFEGAKKKEVEAEEESGAESDSSSDSSESGSEDSDSDDEDEEDAAQVDADIGMEDASSDAGSDDSDDSDDSDEDEDEDDEMEDDEQEEAPKLPDTDVGATVFLRNVPYEATQQEVGTLFRSFGPIRYAKVTLDPATGRTRGTAFVCFWNKEDADAAIAEAERVALETGTAAPGKAGGERKNPFALPSVLTADPSSSLASRLVLHGRTLNVSRAVTRETAGHLAEDNQRAREKGDKRNTYLMREGVVFPNSPAAAALPPSEVEKRQAAFAARKTLLRSNPSLYISKTRLSIRQLPLFVTDRGLKRLGIHAVRAFDDEVKAGTREGLTRIEQDDDTLSAALEGRTKKKGERQTAVVQSKIVRQNEKMDPLTGRGRSKGYGFLELRSHREALKVLRWANNNPEVGPLLWEWWTAEMADIREHARKELAAVKDGKTGKESQEELEARLKKLDGRVGEGDERSGGGMRGGKTLMIEFSVENVQVVRRRVEKVSGPRERQERGSDKGKRKADDGDERDVKRPRRDSRPDKGRRESRGGEERGDRRGKGKADKPGPQPKAEKADEPRGIEKLGSHLGSLIGLSLSATTSDRPSSSRTSMPTDIKDAPEREHTVAEGILPNRQRIGSEEPLVTKWEEWAYYLYYNGDNGVGPLNYSSVLFQSLATAAGHDPRTGSACTDGHCVIRWGGRVRSVPSVILIANGMSFAIMTLLFTTIGSAADYGSVSRWVLLLATLVCWASQFGFLGVTQPSQWELAMGLFVLGFVSYGVTLVFYAAVFPRLARNTARTRAARRQLDNSEINMVEYEVVEMLERNRLSAVSTAHSNWGYLFTLALNLSILIPLASNAMVNNYALAATNVYWILLGFPWFVVQKSRPGPPLPSGAHWLTVGWKQIVSALRYYRRLPNTFAYLAAFFLLADGLNTTGAVVGIVQNQHVHFSFLQNTYLGLAQALCSILSVYAYWHIQRWRAIPTKRMFQVTNAVTVFIPFWGMLGLWTRIGFHNTYNQFSSRADGRWEFWFYQVLFGLGQAPYYAYAQSMMADLTPPGFEGMFFGLFGITNRASSLVGPYVCAAIVDASGNQWSAFVFLFAVCLVAAVGIAVFVDEERGRADALAFAAAHRGAAEAGPGPKPVLEAS